MEADFLNKVAKNTIGVYLFTDIFYTNSLLEKMSTKEGKFYKLLGARINDLRIEKRISFQEMALRCEIDKSHLVKMTSSGAKITIATLYKISKGLEVPLSRIFDFKYD